LTGIANVTVRNISISGANALPTAMELESGHHRAPGGPDAGKLIISNVSVSNEPETASTSKCESVLLDSVLVHDNEGAGIELYHSNAKFPINSAASPTAKFTTTGSTEFSGRMPAGNVAIRGAPQRLIVTNIRVTGNKLHDTCGNLSSRNQ